MDEMKKTAEDVAKDFLAKKAEAPPVVKVEPATTPAPSAEIKKTEETHAAEELKPAVEAKTEQKPVVVDAPKVDTIQLRIDKLVSEIKALKDDRYQDKDKIRQLEAQLITATSKTEPVEVKGEEDRIKKYLEEDKSKPRAQRREMSNEELEDWIVEDMVSAQEWIVDRKLRRKEEEAREASEKKEKNSQAFIAKAHLESQGRVIAKHPDLDTTKRTAELKAQGKSTEDIRSIIFQENPKVEAIVSLLKENPGLAQRIAGLPNGPEILMDEMEKRLDSKKAKTVDVDALSAAAEEGADAERRRIASADSGAVSTREGRTAPGSRDALYNERLKIFTKLGKSKAHLDRALQRREKAGVE